MTPEQQIEASHRSMALSIAQQKLPPTATVDEILAEANKIVAWLKTGELPEVATPAV